MNLELDRKSLDAILRPLTKAAGNVAWQRNVILEVAGDELRLRATDSVIHVEARIKIPEAKATDDGVVAVPAEMLANVVANAGAEMVALETRKNTLRVTAHQDRYDLLTADASQIPDAPPEDGQVVRDWVDAAALLEALDSVHLFQSPTSSRYAIASVLMSKCGHLVATDGLSMACVKTLPKAKADVIVPEYLVDPVRRHAKDMAWATIRTASSWILFDLVGDGMRWIVSGVDAGGVFPEWASVIPTTEAVATVPELLPDELSRAMAQAAIVSDPESRAVRLNVNGRVEMEAKSGSTGEAAISRLWTTEGEAAIALRTDNVQRVAKSAPGAIDMQIHGEGKPVVFASGRWKAVVMPLAMA